MSFLNVIGGSFDAGRCFPKNLRSREADASSESEKRIFSDLEFIFSYTILNSNKKLSHDFL